MISLKLSLVVEEMENIGTGDKVAINIYSNEVLKFNEYCPDDEIVDTFNKLDEHGDRYILLPNQYELNESKIVVDFIESLTNDEHKYMLKKAFTGTGAFRRFKDKLLYFGIRDDWFKYRHEAYIIKAKNFLECHKISYVDDLDPNVETDLEAFYFDKFMEVINENPDLVDVLDIDHELGDDVFFMAQRMLAHLAAQLAESLGINQYYNDELGMKILNYLNIDDYENAFVLLAEECCHAYIEVTVKWSEAPSLLNRKLLIPIKSNVNELMVAVLASLRIRGNHLFALYTDYAKFAFEDELITDCYSGDRLLASLLKDSKKVKLIYDFGENYEFEIKLCKKVYIKDPKLNAHQVIVTKASGYSILEDNKQLLLDSIQNNNIKNLGFDFFDAKIEELKRSVLSEYFCLYDEFYKQYSYETDEDDDFF